MNTPTFIITSSRTSEKVIYKPQIVLGSDFPNITVFRKALGLDIYFMGIIYIMFNEHNIQSVYEEIAKYPSEFRYLSHAENIISVEGGRCVLHKARLGDVVNIVNEKTIKLIDNSEGKELYFTAESIVEHRATLLAMGYIIRDIKLIGFDSYKLNAHIAYKQQYKISNGEI